MRNSGTHSEASMLYVTCGLPDQARDIARTVVEERLAACGNIIEGMRSVYRWEGEVEEGTEVLLLLKTSVGMVERLASRVKELHSFEIPCVVEIPLGSGNPDYFDWIAAETAGESS
ncbi:MAG: divalent-cation tolerance protein CutA [Alphaproteobacteria bacterium]